jgi:hypothetical protein
MGEGEDWVLWRIFPLIAKGRDEWSTRFARLVVGGVVVRGLGG